MYLFDFFIPTWLIFLFLISLLFYKWSITGLDHFSKLKVAHDKPFPLFGTLKGFYLKQENFCVIIRKQYEKYKERKYFGIYEHRTPVLVINDPAIIRRITVTDFDHFVNHNVIFLENTVLGSSILMLKDKKWQDMRALLQPVFESQNLRFMFYLTQECCSVALDNLKGQEVKHDTSMEIDAKDFFMRFTLDVVASTALGIKPDSLSCKNSVLYKKMLSIIRIKPMDFLRFFLFGNIPKIMKFFKISVLDFDFISYFYSLVQDVIKFRQVNNIRHFDIIQLLIDRQEECHEPFAADQNKNMGEKAPNLNETEIVAQCLGILISGFMKTSKFLCFVTLELAANPDIQAKLQKEIDRIRDTSKDGLVTYDQLNGMQYLHKVVLESLRKWTMEYCLDRVCTKPYRISDPAIGHAVDINPGDQIRIPVLALHNDERYFPHPEKFDPERFSEEKMGFMRPYTYLPFGTGPRNCLGTKFSLMQIKAVIVSLLTEFHIEPYQPNVTEVKIRSFGYYLEPEGGYKIRLRYRKQL